MHPLNYVVAHVHWIRAGRHQLDAKRISVTGGFEGLVPPARAFNQCRAHRLRRAAIDVIDDRLDGIAHRSRRILLLQPMMAEVVPGDGFADGRGKVHEANSRVPGARIVCARLETRRRQLDKRDVLSNSNGLRYWCDLPDQRAGLAFTGESKSRFDFSVLRKILCVREKESAARRI